MSASNIRATLQAVHLSAAAFPRCIVADSSCIAQRTNAPLGMRPLSAATSPRRYRCCFPASASRHARMLVTKRCTSSTTTCKTAQILTHEGRDPPSIHLRGEELANVTPGALDLALDQPRVCRKLGATTLACTPLMHSRWHWLACRKACVFASVLTVVFLRLWFGPFAHLQPF